jgi:hypothetical protein
VREEDRHNNGIEIENATWYKLRTLAEGYGLAVNLESPKSNEPDRQS